MILLQHRSDAWEYMVCAQCALRFLLSHIETV